MSEDLQRLYIKEFSPGTVLFTEGERGDDMYIVKEGAVRISRRLAGREYVLSVIKDGGFFGEMALLLGRPRSATATVISPSRILIVNRRFFHHMIASDPELAIKMMKSLAERLLRANHQIETLLMEDKTYRVMLALHHCAQEDGRKEAHGTIVPVTTHQLANFTGLQIGETSEILDRLSQAHLIVPHEEGFLIPEDDNYLEYLEFLELKEKNNVP